MASRTVSVLLQAQIGGYVSDMTKAAAVTKGFGESANTSTAKASKGFDIAGKGAVLMGAAVVGALVGVISQSMAFEKAMSAVGAATGAAGGTLLDLRAAAIKAGADTAFSATEAANAITEMAKAGVSAKDIMGGGLSGALALAAAGQIDVAEAAGIAATAMTQFSLTGKDLPHVADLLAAGAGKAMGSVDDLGQALNQAGLVAAASGLSIEETTGTLAAFASAGLIGSDAGTSMKTAMQKLQAPSKEAAQTMSELGINMYDANGNMLSMAGMAGQLQDHMSGLTQEQRNNALATIFGSDAVRAANVLYKEGAEGIEGWTRKVNDSGYAAKQAAALQDNLSGDLEKLGGAASSLAVGFGSLVTGPLRGLTQGITDLLSGPLGALPGALSAVAGFIADNKDIALALASALAVQLAGGIGAVTVAFNSMILTPVVLGLSSLLGVAGSLPAVFAAARTAIAGFLTAAAPLAAVAGIVYAITKIVETAHAAENAREEIAGMWDAAADSGRGSAQFKALAGYVDDLEAKVKHLRHEIDDRGFWDMVWSGPFTDRGDAAALEEYEKALGRAEDASRRAAGTADMLGSKYHLTQQQVMDLAEKYDIDLTAGVESVNRVWNKSGAAAEVASGGIAQVGNTAGMSKAQIEAATKAQEDWLGQLQKVATGFVDPLAAYTGLLQVKQEAEQAAAEKTASTTKDSSDSWRDYVKDAKVSLDEYEQKLRDQITAQQNWQTNIITITQVAGIGVGQQLAAMGIEGAGLVQQMVDAIGTDQFPRLASLMTQEAALAGDGAAGALDTKMKVMAAVAAAGGKATVQSIAAELGVGVGVVAGIFAQYSNSVAGGVNPLLLALGKPTLAGYHVAGLNGGPGGTQVKNAWVGGYMGDGGMYEPKGVVHGGEYVLTKQQTSRLGIDRIEAFANGYAAGGFVSAASVPRPYSTAPYSGAVGAPGSAGMSKEYDEVTAWLNANMGAMGGGGPAGAGVQRWLPLVLASLNLVGQPAGLAQTVLRRMQQESGGNPRAINLTDINAKRGTPSKGLMQVIDPTFRAYAMAGHASDIWDPLSNLLASERYAMARYGSLSAAYNKAGGYAAGGTTPAGDPFWVGENGPELMWSSQQKYVSSAARSREFSGGSGPGGSSSSAAASGPSQVSLQLDGPAVAALLRGEVVSVLSNVNRTLVGQGVR